MNDVSLNTCKITHFSKKIKSLLLLLGLAFSPMSWAADLDLSTIDGTNGVRFVGGNPGDTSGTHISNAGDVNGDGLDDILIGNSVFNGDPNISSYVVFGTTQGLPSPFVLSSLNGVNGFRMEIPRDVTDENNTLTGDVNGDGLNDLIFTREILYGSTTGFSHPFNFADIDGSNGVLVKIDTIDLTSSVLSVAGDINDDGIDDLVLRTRNFRTSSDFNEGECHIIFGQLGGLPHPFDVSTLDGANGFTIRGERRGSNLRHSNTLCSSASTAGDINHDGIDDLLIGGGSDPGDFYIVYGSRAAFDATINLEFSPLDGTNGFKLTSTAQSYSVSAAGDVNGDGIDDVILGNRADSDNRAGADEDEGYASLMFGNAGGFQPLLDLNDLYDTGQAIRFETSELSVARNGIGFHVSGVDDVNNDGLADIMLGTVFNGQNAPDVGSSYLLYGNAQGFSHPVDLFSLDDRSGLRINGEVEVDFANMRVSSGGDFNGDGTPDILVGQGATTVGGELLVGAAYLIYGPPKASSTPTPEKNLVANYENDFRGLTPSAGWDYFWNPSEEVGNASGYQTLQWTGGITGSRHFAFDSDGVAGRDSSQLNYGYLNRTGGHPGKGMQGDRVSADRFVIAAYKVGQKGVFHIEDSVIEQPLSGCSQWSNGGEMRVYVNDTLMNTVFYSGESKNFDTSLGELNVGDTVYIAMGPNGRDGCDKFLLDYSIMVEGPITNTPPILGWRSEQVVPPSAASFSFNLGVSDDDGDSLTFKATGLPEGVSIDINSGRISGSGIAAGIYSVTVTVTDIHGASDEMKFLLTIGTPGVLVADYQDDFHSGAAWSYLWNANGLVGTANNYTALLWNGFHYDGDGVPGAENTELSYGKLARTVSHPGKGTSKGAVVDRFVIAAYNFEEPGAYKITDSYAEHLVSGCSRWSNGGEVRIYVNDTLQDTTFYGKESRTDFDMALGNLNAGDTLYVAVGPNGNGGCDGFLMDFSVVKE